MPKMTLTDARDALGWTKTRLALESGVPLSTISDLESGDNKSPGYGLVMRVIAALRTGGLAGISPEDVFPVPAASGASDKRGVA